MDPQTIGWIGGIAGAVIGCGGAAIGLYASLARAKGPAERRFLWLGAGLLILLIGVFLTALFLLPSPWKYAAWGVYPIVLTALIVSLNRRQAAVRQRESGG